MVAPSRHVMLGCLTARFGLRKHPSNLNRVAPAEGDVTVWALFTTAVSLPASPPEERER